MRLKTGGKIGRTLLVVFGLACLVNTMVHGGGQPPGNRQVMEFGLRVEAPKEWKGYQIVIEQLDRKPETVEFEFIFLRGDSGLRHFRHIMNLNIFARSIENPADIREIASFDPDLPEIVVTVPFSDYDLMKTRDLMLLFWVPQRRGGYWEAAEVFERDITEFKRNDHFFSFRVTNWPLDDRAIACGG